MKQNNIYKLISKILEEDYSKAKDTLQEVVNEKLAEKIKTAMKDLKEKSK